MPLKTNVGVNRKVADNNYGSRGASVNLEVELDSSLIQEPERLQERIRQLFRLAKLSVDDELSGQNTGNGHDNARPAAAGGDGNGHTTAGNGNGSKGRTATEKQLTYARQLAGQIKGLGVRRLETLCQKMYGKPVAAISSMEGSGLIDTLKAIKEGKIDLDSVLNEAAT
jgi:hypothetical protein